MRYIREVPGTVYEEQLDDVLRNAGLEPEENTIISVDSLNGGFSESPSFRRYLKKNGVTGGIYTIPSQRKELDFTIKEYFDAHSDECDAPYAYNKYLYEDSFDAGQTGLERFDFSNKEAVLSLVGSEITVTDGVLNIDLSDFRDKYAVENFDIKSICQSVGSGIESIGYINANSIVFLGETVFAFDDAYESPSVTGGAFFNGATFAGDIKWQNFSFRFEKSASRVIGNLGGNKLDFRNTRFFGDVSFKDVVFSGALSEAEVSFEDARIKKGESNKLEFINVDFGQTLLNFFQITVGDFIDSCQQTLECNGDFPNEISFKNVSVSDESAINFADAEIHNCAITFKNISSMPMTNLCFAPITVDAKGNGKDLRLLSPDNRLIIDNCEIRQTVSISNVSELSLKNTKNYGRIVGDSSWGNFFSFDKSNYFVRSRGFLEVTRFGGINIYNNLLLAVYNFSRNERNCEELAEINLNKAKDFLMLKENFASLGEYDDEDDAFILYMEFKPCSILERKHKRYSRKRNKNEKDGEKQKKSKPMGSLWYRLIFRFLYDTGKYGISPLRVIISLLILVSAFTIIYFLCASLMENAFSIGNTLNKDYGSPNGIMAGLGTGFSFKKFWASLLYSVEGIIPFVSQFEAISAVVSVFTAIENAIGSFLVGYFSVAVIRKTLR